MDLKIIVVLIIASLLIITVVVIHWLGAVSHNESYEVSDVNNTMNAWMARNYGGNSVNYTMVMTERSEMARNRHVIRLCNG